MRALLIGAGLLAGVLVITLVVVLSQGPTRSVHAVCHVWDTDGLALHNQFDTSAGDTAADPIGELGELMSVPGQAASLMDKMAAVAPTYVSSDFSQLAKVLQQEKPSSNLMSGLVGALTASAEAEGPSQAINNFLSQNCAIPESSGGTP